MRMKSIIGVILIVSGLIITVIGYEEREKIVCHYVSPQGYSAPVHLCSYEQIPSFQIMFYIGIIVVLSGIGLFVYSRIR